MHWLKMNVPYAYILIAMELAATNAVVMYNITTNKKEAQHCSDRRYYNREAFKVYRKKRKIQSIYDYE